jgi:hypothetical protein
VTSVYTYINPKQRSDVLRKVVFAMTLLGLAGQVMADAINLSFSNSILWALDVAGSRVEINGDVLSFDGSNTSSNHTADLYSTNFYQGGTLSFEYKGALGSDGGGYVGVSQLIGGSVNWRAGARGPTYMDTGKLLQKTGDWKTYSVNIGSGRISLAQFFNTTGGDAQFQNLILTSVPEPESYAMLLLGLGLIGSVARSRKKQAVNL